jgi:ADP-ribosylglycohydrolase
MHNNQETLDWLFEREIIALEKSSLFDIPVEPKSSDFDFDKVEGMLLGLAIGDSLGNTSESMFPSDRKDLYGETRDYWPNPRADLGALGTPSDDTQLAFWTLEHLLEQDGLVPDKLAEIFSTSQIFGIGNTVRRFVMNMRSGTTWYEAGPQSEASGNGALMRIAPILVPHLKSGGTGLWADTALCAMITHNDRTSTASCLAFVLMLWELLDKNKNPDDTWWANRFTEISGPLEGEVKLRSTPNPHMDDFEGSLTDYCSEYVVEAIESGTDYETVIDSWYSGAYLLETVPAALLILSRFGHDPEEAIVRAVNDTWDNDTIAAIVGAAVGALHGKSALPDRWVDNLTGRTKASDDGKIFELIEKSRTEFRG